MIYFADFETTTNNEERTSVYLWTIISEDEKVKEYGIDLKTFFEFLNSLNKIEAVYFHNLSWDGCFIEDWLIENNFKFDDEKTRFRNNTFRWINDDDYDLYSLDVKFKNKKVIRFKDSYKIFPTSIAKMAKVVGLEKGIIDYEKYSNVQAKEDLPQEVVDYAILDALILVRYWNASKKNLEVKRLTISSIVYNEFKAFYGKTKFISHFGGYIDKKTINNVISKEEFLEFYKGYKGGLVLVKNGIKDVELKVDGYSYDVNSMYPWVMKTKLMPYGKPSSIKYENVENVAILKVYINKAYILDEEIPCFVFSQSKLTDEHQKHKKLIIDEVIVVTEFEFELIKKYYFIDFQILNKWYFKASYIFKNFISELEEQKTNAKNEADRQVAKIKLNSLYGKFGQKFLRSQRILIKKEDLLPDQGVKFEIGNYYEVSKIEEVDLISYVPVALFITSYARVHLLENIIKNKERFLYADTDSIYLDGMQEGLQIDETSFGAFKLENRFSRFKYIKAKCYIFETLDGKITTKIAGLSKDKHKDINFSNFYKGSVFEKSKTQRKRIKGGFILTKGDYTL